MSVMNKPEDVDKQLENLEKMLKYNKEMGFILNSRAREVIISSLRATRLLTLRKWAVLRGELKRAVPPVGITWLGPAT